MRATVLDSPCLEHVPKVIAPGIPVVSADQRDGQELFAGVPFVADNLGEQRTACLVVFVIPADPELHFLGKERSENIAFRVALRHVRKPPYSQRDVMPCVRPDVVNIGVRDAADAVAGHDVRHPISTAIPDDIVTDWVNLTQFTKLVFAVAVVPPLLAPVPAE